MTRRAPTSRRVSGSCEGWASYQRSKSVHFIEGCSPVAELLSDEFTVVTYDRRGNSRSPRPGGWDGTSTEEQSDDAGALIEALGIVPAAVFGTSGGAIIGLDLVIRHPELVRGAILHDSAMFSVLPNPEEALGAIQQVVEGGQLTFDLTNDGPWPVGEYEVELFLNGEEEPSRTLEFEVR
jgi:pimeloyl-ACP methyl ester carboxylesterase